MYVWRGRQLCGVVRAHEGPVMDMCACRDGPDRYVVTGGRDGRVAAWRVSADGAALSPVLRLGWADGALEVLPDSDAAAASAGAAAAKGPVRAHECVRSVAMRAGGEGRLELLLGGASSALRAAEISVPRAAQAGLGPAAAQLLWQRGAMQGHGGWPRGVSGLCASGHCSEAYSAGGDGWLRVWDPARCVGLAALAVGEAASAVDCGPVSGRPELLGVGLCAGGVLLLDLGELRRRWRAGGAPAVLGDVLLDRVGDGRGEVTEVKFSPDGSVVAVGTRSDGVHLYSAAGHGRRGVCRGHLAGVWRIDWSACGRFLRTTGAAADALVWRTDRPGKALALDQARTRTPPPQPLPPAPAFSPSPPSPLQHPYQTTTPLRRSPPAPAPPLALCPAAAPPTPAPGPSPSPSAPPVPSARPVASLAAPHAASRHAASPHTSSARPHVPTAPAPCSPPPPSV